jgi:uncharacterized membrane protein YphA (DoxX/SURF4 family)
MSITSKAPVVARVLLGLPFLVFGLNAFLGFMPQPPHEGVAATFLGGLAAAGYVFPLMKGVEVVAGALLLSGRLVPLALTLLAPITVNILAFHVFLEPAGAVMALALTGLQLYLAWAYRDAFRGVLDVHAKPAVSPTVASRAPATALQRAA